MTRTYIGKDAAGTYLARFARPGKSALTGLPYYLKGHGNQPPNEISFDSRWAAFGDVIASGIKTGFGFVNFPAQNFYPMVEVLIRDGDGFLHHQNIRTLEFVPHGYAHSYRGPSFIVDVEKHRFKIVNMLSLFSGASFVDGVNCGTNPTFKYVVYNAKGFV